MKITVPFIPIELEIAARRRTGPYRIRVRTLLIIFRGLTQREIG
jgi:hypothetical protein